MHARIFESISSIRRDDWNRLLPDSNPFVRHEFLQALEDSACVGESTGWDPCPAVVEDDAGRIVAAMPLYRKSNSHGEFVFDFAWANAYHQSGLRYYPKLVAAVPYTPATGPRLLLDPEYGNTAELAAELVRSAVDLAGEQQVSSLHILFPEQRELQQLRAGGFMLRKDCQFQWHNHDYESFAAFLDTFSSSKRKKTRRERRRVEEAGIRFEVRHGNEIDAALWQEIMPLYYTTFLRRGRDPYLKQPFFELIAELLPQSLVVFLGYRNDELVATAICFRSDDTLYGRYWGAERFIDSLHFETCYYQGIDYCIEHGLQRFEPGTQGEHKVSRGFVPTATWSAHWLAHPRFAEVIDDYLVRERAHIDQYIDAVRAHVPYREGYG